MRCFRCSCLGPMDTCCTWRRVREVQCGSTRPCIRNSLRRAPTARRRSPPIRAGHYTYPNGAAALHDVDFTVPSSHVRDCRSSGSGKSTLAGIFFRSAHRRGRSPSMTGLLGVLAVELAPATALANRSMSLSRHVRENIVYGCATATDAAIQRAVAVANLSDVVAQMPRTDTLWRTRGDGPGGQRRHRHRACVIAISILLDEATSHLDAVSEQLVQQALVNASRGRTTIVIAHRLSTIREADKLIVFDHGRIVEEGTWEALEAAGGAFQRLLRSV